MDCYQPKKDMLNLIYELKNLLTFMKIEYAELSLEDLQIKIEKMKIKDPMKIILDNIEKRKNINV